MSESDNKSQQDNSQNQPPIQADDQTSHEQTNGLADEITQKLTDALTNAIAKDGITAGANEVIEALQQNMINGDPDEHDDHDFDPLDDYDAEEKAAEADEDRLAAAEDKEETDEEPDDSSPDYNRWSQDQQTEDEAIANGVSPDSPDGWADLDPDWETGRDQTDDNADNDDEDHGDDKR